MALPPASTPAPESAIARRDALQQDVFLREVDDALRQDEMAGLLRRYGTPIGVAIAIGLAALGGYLWWDHAQKQQAAERGEQLTMAIDRLQAGQVDSADKQLAGLTAAGDGSGAAARLLRAGIALQQNKPDQAAGLYGQVAADTAAPRPLRDLATVRQVSVEFDKLAPQQVIDRLKPLAVPGNPWFGTAGELVGTAYLKQGKPELAGPLFAAISRDKQAPESLRRRARQMAGMLGVDAIDDVNQAVGQIDGQPEGAPPPAEQ